VLVRIVRDATVQVDAIEDRLLHGRLSVQRGELDACARARAPARLLAPRAGRAVPPAAPAAALDRAHDLDENAPVPPRSSRWVIATWPRLQERIKLLQERWRRSRRADEPDSVHPDHGHVLALPINIMTGLSA